MSECKMSKADTMYSIHDTWRSKDCVVEEWTPFLALGLVSNVFLVLKIYHVHHRYSPKLLVASRANHYIDVLKVRHPTHGMTSFDCLQETPPQVFMLKILY
ncbi:hypothetical protein GOP47_0026958 [Adiantum capillus-veneris]|nr:hypothetical protein GOP47_0026958 [Adiantum capillus-veneris]